MDDETTMRVPMGFLAVGNRFKVPGFDPAYEVTGDCASNNGILYARHLTTGEDLYFANPDTTEMLLLTEE